MSMPWDNDYNQNNDFHHEGENNHEDHGDQNNLDDLFGGDNNHTEDGDNNTPQGDTENDEFLENLEDEMVSAPKNKRGVSTPQYSERDVYRIVNLVIVFDAMNDKQKKWTDLIFSVNVGGANNDVKRAMNIGALERKEIDEKIAPVEVLSTIYEVATTQDAAKAIDGILEGITAVESLSTEDRGALVSLLRKIAKQHPNAEGKVVPIRVTRNSSGAEIVSATRGLVAECEGVGESIDFISTCTEAIVAALS